MKYYSATKKAMMRGWMNIKNMKMDERRQTQRVHTV